ncbi:MAG: toxin [Candidatus Omnitrophica bacterium]|nr:toxin [Candidatus Omnitrophota bacterium]
MREILWSEEKNLKLKKERGASFEDIIAGEFLGIENNPSRDNQKFMLFAVNNYVWVVPYVDDEKRYFLKTAFPSRKHTKIYLKGT